MKSRICWEAQAAEATWEELKLALPELNIGLVHGRMKSAEKQAVMSAFKQGELHLLVATTVIEVGVDVPNSSLMIIENPERLGLAQLHQLRGRVGRGAVASHCVLLYKSPLSKTAQKRLQVLRDSNDGFVIAQKDLEIRGPGELLGTRQTGNAEFKVADLMRDQAHDPRSSAHRPSYTRKISSAGPGAYRALDAGNRTLFQRVARTLSATLRIIFYSDEWIMKRELAIEFSRVTEAAALAGYKWLGRGDKNTADGAAVNAMRIMLNLINIDGTIVIGEGEIDEAPMLYIGERVGTGNGDAVDIAVDPIEGTRMTAMGQANALAVMAVGDKGCFLNAPDMYMEKLIVGPGAKGTIDLNLPLAENLQNIARALNKPLSELTVTILAKPRHDEVIVELQKLGVRVFAIPDGDVAASILTCMPDSEVDVMYGIGGAPEGVVSAAVIRALDGDMHGRLLARHHVKGDSEENRRIGENELARCQAMGIEAGKVLRLDDMARSDNVVFSATGITKGDLLDGITRKGNMATTETLLIRGKSRTIRRIQSIHYLDRKDPDIQLHIL
ncbi:Fructose-1,6-bisphosphatase [Klebsiella oxytoca]|nr:Fructose-1,6-bisphosphatase [Klebsiella oxytoca]